MELHSPDARHTVVLRCPDQSSALTWFSVMHAVTSTLTQVCRPHAQQLSHTPYSNTLHLYIQHLNEDVLNDHVISLQQALAEVIHHTTRSGFAGSKEIRHLGWLAGKVRSKMCIPITEGMKIIRATAFDDPNGSLCTLLGLRWRG